MGTLSYRIVVRIVTAPDEEIHVGTNDQLTDVELADVIDLNEMTSMLAWSLNKLYRRRREGLAIPPMHRLLGTRVVARRSEIEQWMIENPDLVGSQRITAAR